MLDYRILDDEGIVLSLITIPSATDLHVSFAVIEAMTIPVGETLIVTEIETPGVFSAVYGSVQLVVEPVP